MRLAPRSAWATSSAACKRVVVVARAAAETEQISEAERFIKSIEEASRSEDLEDEEDMQADHLQSRLAELEGKVGP